MAAPLLLLHPFPLDAAFWDEVLAVLPDDRVRLTPDFPGFGDAPAQAAPSIVGHADSVAERIAAASSGPAVVVGSSMGGFVALSLVARHPEAVAGLMLLGTSASADPPERIGERDAAIARIRDEGPGGYLSGFLPALMSPSADSVVRERVGDIARRASSTALVGALAAMRDRPDRAADLEHIGVPTVVVGGEDDARTPSDLMRSLANGIPGAALALVPAAGHLAAAEDPNAIVALITPLVAAVDAGLATGGGRA